MIKYRFSITGFLILAACQSTVTPSTPSSPEYHQAHQSQDYSTFAPTEEDRQFAKQISEKEVREKKFERISLPGKQSLLIENRNGIAIIDDMIFGEIEDLKKDPSSFLPFAEARKWPTDDSKVITIPYSISSDFDAKKDEDTKWILEIKAAINVWNATGVVKFKNHEKEKYFLKVTKSEDSDCSTTLGMTSKPYMDLGNSGSLCKKRGPIIHELGHAIGLSHEIKRSDRDSFVIYNQKNKKSSCSDANFEKVKTDLYDVPFDFDSLMLYNSYQCAVSREKPVYVKKSNKNPVEEVNRSMPSKCDLETVKRAYKLKSAGSVKITEAPCP